MTFLGKVHLYKCILKIRSGLENKCTHGAHNSDKAGALPVSAIRNKQFVISYFEIWTFNPPVAGSSPVISLKPYMGERCSSIGRAGKYKKLTVTGILFLFYFEKNKN